MVLRGESSTSSNADDGSPRQSLPTLSTSSSMMTGFIGAGFFESPRPCDPGSAPHIGPPMTADLRLVRGYHPATHARKLRPSAARHGLAQRCLADTWRSNEGDDRTRNPGHRPVGGGDPSRRFLMARNSTMRSLTSSSPVWSASRIRRGLGDVEAVLRLLTPGPARASSPG